jgi:hypothetical protein
MLTNREFNNVTSAYHGFEIEQNECGFFNVPFINCFSTPTVLSAKKAIDAYAVRNGLDETGRRKQTYPAPAVDGGYIQFRRVEPPLERTPCPHKRLNEDGVCRTCGTDRTGI